MPRFPAPPGEIHRVDPELAPQGHELETIEELGDEAIIAQESQAHLPQKRVNVQDESRSVVISDEPPTSSRRPPVYRGRGEPTLVMRDRPDLELLRRQLLERRAVPQKSTPPSANTYLWAGLAIAAFAAGGLVTLLLVRGAPARTLDAVAPVNQHAEQPRRVATPAAQVAAEEPPTPQVKLEELPLEKPKRR